MKQLSYLSSALITKFTYDLFIAFRLMETHNVSNMLSSLHCHYTHLSITTMHLLKKIMHDSFIVLLLTLNPCHSKHSLHCHSVIMFIY